MSLGSNCQNGYESVARNDVYYRLTPHFPPPKWMGVNDFGFEKLRGVFRIQRELFFCQGGVEGLNFPGVFELS